MVMIHVSHKNKLFLWHKFFRLFKITKEHVMNILANFLLTETPNIYSTYFVTWGHTLARWLRECTTNRQFVGSIPAGVI
jgi:hypothetical protein